MERGLVVGGGVSKASWEGLLRKDLEEDRFLGRDDEGDVYAWDLEKG